ncbi:MAG: hypothetical protein P4N59_33050 [Negativicutes bacterium]|nr:hypothetical protein [Negativicutes bacterium]
MSGCECGDGGGGKVPGKANWLLLGTGLSREVGSAQNDMGGPAAANSDA